MSDLYKKIEDLCAAKKINITVMCRQSGASRGSLSDLKMGRKQFLSADTLQKIANYFGVSIDYLLGNTEEKTLTPKDERPITFDDFSYAMYEEFKGLTEENKKKLLEMAEFFRQQQKKEKKGR